MIQPPHFWYAPIETLCFNLPAPGMHQEKHCVPATPLLACTKSSNIIQQPGLLVCMHLEKGYAPTTPHHW